MNKTIVTLTIMLAAAALVAVFSSPATAAVSGVCSNCHTMHNSQEGSPMRWDDESEPLSSLLLGTCLGCHTTDGGDPLGDTNAYPYVMDTGNLFNDGNCLAGGFFPNTMGTGNNDDNHHGVSVSQINLPAGYAADEDMGPGEDWYTGDTVGNGLACAGSNGCHGVHDVVDDMEAISGGHHTPGAYRMLFVGNTMATDGVAGVPAPDYEEDLIKNELGTSEHNTYSAELGDYSISELCAICHGNFHNESGGPGTDTGTASPWLRHPTDVLIPSDWIIGDEGTYILTASDYKNNPVGYAFAGDTPGTQRMATCVSCHRAHGTDNDDLLRWDYDTQEAGSTTAYGCLGCHDKQRGS